MADPGLFHSTGSIHLGEIAGLASRELSHGADPGREFLDVAPLEHAGPHAFYPVPAADQSVHCTALIDGSAKIGAGTSIGLYAVIGGGSKIDNPVQIGHNVQMGRGCAVVAQAGVAGSTQLGDHVMLAAQAGVADHVHLGEGARVAAKSGVMRDVPSGTTVCGAPGIWLKKFFRLVAIWNRPLKSQTKKP